MTIAYRNRGPAAAAALAAAIGLAGCGGTGSPHVASSSNSGAHAGRTTTTTLPHGNPTQLLDEWASCMRAHGDPDQSDPTIDANKVIHITIPPGAAGQSGGPSLGSSPCGAYLTAASTALRGGKPLPKPDPAKLASYSECMRANGIPDFPDPANGDLSIHVTPGSDLNPRNPAFQNASKVCSKKTGVRAFGGGTPPPGAIDAQSSGGPGGGPGGNGGAAAGGQSGGGQAG